MKSFKLDDIEKQKPPFKVPEGYFEDLPMKIQSRIEDQKRDRFVTTPVFRLAFASAMVLLVTSAVVYTVFFTGQSSVEDLLADVPQEELMAYIDLMEFEDNDILAAFEGTIESIDFESDGLEEVEIGEEVLDDLLLEYDLSDEFL